MSIVNVLKITHNGNTVLFSEMATQSISPISEYKILKNINNNIIHHDNYTTLFKITIRTLDIPNADLLRLGEKYKIYSVIEFSSTNKPNCECILSETNNRNTFGYVYRPIFDAILIDFKCIKKDNDPTQEWIMDFVQI